MSDQPYDARTDTTNHIERVQVLMGEAVENLRRRSAGHDRSKRESPEKEAFDILTSLLNGLTYGSDEYRAALRAMKPALDHHYANNPHHPEHWTDGIAGMSLLDLLEMVADWRAATERRADGSMDRSLAINAERFGVDAQLTRVIANTVAEMGWRS